MVGINQFIVVTISLFNNVIMEDNPKCFNFLEKLKDIQPELLDVVKMFDTD